MGFRFRKSVKIAPGIKINFNKKSWGVTVGKRGAHYTINSKGKRTASVGIPGTGLSYTTSSGGKKSKPKPKTKSKEVVEQQYTAKANNKADIANKISQLKLKKYLFLVLGIFLIYLWLSKHLGIAFPVLGIFCIYLSIKYNKSLLGLKNKEIIVNCDENISNNTINDSENLNSNYDISESDLMNISTYCRQLKETIDLIETSKNPDTVISRFDFLEEIYSKLSCISDSVPNWDELGTDLENLITNRDEYINNAIHKSLDAELIKINELKTEKGKINRLNRFFENTKAIPNLSAENYEYIDKLKKETKIE